MSTSEKENKVKIENFIKKFRQYNKLTQEKLAQKSRVSTRAMQNYERGERLPDVQTVQRIAQALDVTVDDLYPMQRLAQ